MSGNLGPNPKKDKRCLPKVRIQEKRYPQWITSLKISIGEHDRDVIKTLLYVLSLALDKIRETCCPWEFLISSLCSYYLGGWNLYVWDRNRKNMKMCQAPGRNKQKSNLEEYSKTRKTSMNSLGEVSRKMSSHLVIPKHMGK